MAYYHEKIAGSSLSAIDLYHYFKEEHCPFLDSSKMDDNKSQYSIIGYGPYRMFSVVDEQCYVDDVRVEGDPFIILNGLLQKDRIQIETDLPFVGGAIGYIGYELLKSNENIDLANDQLLEIPNMVFQFFRGAMIVDHTTGHIHVTELTDGDAEPHFIDQIAYAIKHKIKSFRVEINFNQKRIEDLIENGEVRSAFDQCSYVEAVEKMRCYIEEGDIYIANMTHRMVMEKSMDSYDLFRALRSYNPAPFGAYLPYEHFQVISSSPERFLKIENGQVTTRPIKGTVPKGQTREEDRANIKRLLHSQKDRSELLMIVDLERNDLSKVCQPGTVDVSELFEIESYATVHHLVAQIQGQLEISQNEVDCVKACFPGGSITGTPKVRAMEIIEELERSARQIYTGCIGYFSHHGTSDHNIVIRTLVKQGEKLVFGVGGGVTWESDPLSEYQETLDKAYALMKLLTVDEVTYEVND